MDYTHFLFAFFVFILLFALLFTYNRLKAKTPNSGASPEAQGRERQLFALYQNLEDMLSGMEEYVEGARAEIAEKLEQAQEKCKLAEELYAKLNDALGAGVFAQISAPAAETAKAARGSRAAKPAQPPGGPAAPEPAKDMTKHDRVWLMKSEGASPDEIARELGVSRGEVRLILGIKKNT